MIVKIQLEDAVYASLLSGNARIQGSIGLVNPTEGNFNAHNRIRNQPNHQYMKLPHGRVSVNDEKVRLHLCINRDEAVVPARAIEKESLLASEYITLMEDLV